MKKTTDGNRLSFEKDALRRMNQGELTTVDRSELERATGGFSVRCPSCELSSTKQTAE